MAVKKDFPGLVWQCKCGKWNFADAPTCWKCHQPKYPQTPSTRKSKNISNQSKEADILKKAVQEQKILPVLQVHDDLEVERPKKRGRPKKEVVNV